MKTQTVKLSKALVYLDEPYSVQSILFTVDGNPEVIMTEEGVEICPTMVNYLKLEDISTIKTSDSEELLDKLFTQSNYNSLIK
jgi:hypothetical protein